MSGLLSLMNGDLTITPRIMHERVERDGRTQADFTAGNRVNLRQFDIAEPSESEWTLSTLTANYDAGFGSFVSASSWFDRTFSAAAAARLARGAIGLFPMLADVRVMRSYLGFRPYSPDHLPVIGPDPRAPGLWHACGHEGAGIGLSAGTGRLIAQSLCGVEPDLDLAPFAPNRFGENR